MEPLTERVIEIVQEVTDGRVENIDEYTTIEQLELDEIEEGEIEIELEEEYEINLNDVQYRTIGALIREIKDRL